MAIEATQHCTEGLVDPTGSAAFPPYNVLKYILYNRPGTKTDVS